jgi:hypothetical protein
MKLYGSHHLAPTLGEAQASQTAAVQENAFPPPGAPVIGLKYSANPCLLINSLVLDLIISASFHDPYPINLNQLEHLKSAK